MRWKNESVINLLKEYRETGIDDPVEMVKGLARDLVYDAQSKGWEGPPYNIFELASFEDITVQPNKFLSEARVVTSNNNQFIIEYNPFKPETRTRFSIAHEIAHTLFPDCSEKIRYRMKEPTVHVWELEFLCNIAASELLLPLGDFSIDIEGRIFEPETILALSKKYKASIEAVIHRFVDITKRPTMFAIAEFDLKTERLKVAYSKASFPSMDKLPVGKSVPNSSEVYHCLRPGWTSKVSLGFEEFSSSFNSISAIGLSQLKNDPNPRVAILFDSLEVKKNDYAKIIKVYGDATEPRGNGVKVIGQIVNTSAATGAGFGKSLVKKFPVVKKALNNWKSTKDFGLGSSNIIDVGNDTFVFQMVAQKGIHRRYGEIPLKYKSLQKCLHELRNAAKDLEASVHIPLIGAGNARGDWSIIEQMIEMELSKNGIPVIVYVLPGTTIPEKKNSLTLF